MKKILFVFLTLLSTTSFAFFGNSSIKVLCYGDKSVDLIYTYGNRPLEPRALEVEFFLMEEVLHEKVKIH